MSRSPYLTPATSSVQVPGIFNVVCDENFDDECCWKDNFNSFCHEEPDYFEVINITMNAIFLRFFLLFPHKQVRINYSPFLPYITRIFIWKIFERIYVLWKIVYIYWRIHPKRLLEMLDFKIPWFPKMFLVFFEVLYCKR